MSVACAGLLGLVWVGLASGQDRSLRDDAVTWLKENNNYGPDSGFVSDMTQVIDENLAEDMNINFFFGSDLMSSGSFKTLHLYNGSLLSFELSSDQAAAMQLESSSVQVSTSGAMGRKAERATFELTDLQIDSASDVNGAETFRGRVMCKATAPSTENGFAIRVGYRAQAGTAQFKYLDVTPDAAGTPIEFEFGPINDADETETYTGPLAVMFDIVTVNQENGDTTSHSNVVGQMINVR
jgi:hypothetical protein